MKKELTPVTDAEVKEEKALAVSQTQSLDKPQKDIEFAHVSAQRLKDMVTKMKWVSNIKGKEHLQFEAWQTIGKFYGYLVDTDSKEPEYVQYGNVWGFKAHAQVINEHTGIRVGGASAICMSDEYNWKGRDKYAIMSMAQTRAGSKALRQILSWVVALAGYNPTPLEEMTDERPKSLYQVAKENPQVYQQPEKPKEVPMINSDQQVKVRQLMVKKGKTMEDIETAIAGTQWNGHAKTKLDELTEAEAHSLINRMEQLPDKKI